MSRAIELIHERTRNSIWSVLVLALIIRLAFPVLVAGLAESPKVFHAADSGLYLNPAISLIKTGKFVASPDNPTPEITRTPGYPVFLLPAVILGKVELVAIAMQILVSCLTVYLVYRIGLLLFAKNPTAILCALFYTSIEPLSVIFTSLIMTETLFTCLLAACVFFLLRYLQTRCINRSRDFGIRIGRVCFCAIGFALFASMGGRGSTSCRMDQKS